jgi:hypothetical protein
MLQWLNMSTYRGCYTAIFSNILYLNKQIYCTVLQQLSTQAHLIKSRYKLYKQRYSYRYRFNCVSDVKSVILCSLYRHSGWYTDLPSVWIQLVSLQPCWYTRHEQASPLPCIVRWQQFQVRRLTDSDQSVVLHLCAVCKVCIYPRPRLLRPPCCIQGQASFEDWK